MATFMQNFPTTAPNKLFPSTCAVADVSFKMLGSPSGLTAFDVISFK
jgi:hypothetical protein